MDHFLDLEGMIRSDRENQIAYELHFKQDTDDSSVKFVDDPICECKYAVVSGQRKDEFIKLIEENTEIRTAEEMFADWDKATNDSVRINAILKIGVAAPQEYDDLFAAKLKEVCKILMMPYAKHH